MKKPHNFRDLSNKSFGRLTVRYLAFTKKSRNYWSCICDCGSFATVPTDKLKSGHTKSCGCLHIETVTKHNLSRSRFYRIWYAMKTRSGNYENYKNVKCCTRWKKFENFYTDMYKGYIDHCNKYGKSNTTIDRIDNKKGYKKDNCRWATYDIQNNNNNRNRFYKHDGRVKTVAQWYHLFKPDMSLSCFTRRVINYGWTIDKAVQTPKRASRKSSR